MVEGSQGASGGVAGDSTDADSDDAATRAERLFDSLLEHAVAARNGRAVARPVAAAVAQPEVSSPPQAATLPAQPPPAATNGVAGGADPIGGPKGVTTAEILVLGQAMEYALEAIHRRLTSIEHILLTEPGANAGSAELTMASPPLPLLRSAVDGGESTTASLPQEEAGA